MEGWIRIHRQTLESDIWKSKPFSRGQAWIDLLLLANYKSSFFFKSGHKIDVKRGQIAIPKAKFSTRWGWSDSKIERYLDHLKNESQIEYQKSSVTTLITILNYDRYQVDESSNESRTKNQRKPSKKEKNIKGKLNSLPKTDQSILQPHEKVKLDSHEVDEKYFHDVCEVIDYLNLKSLRKGNQKLKPESKSSKHIRGRFRENFTVEDLKLVIDLKIEEWLNDSKMKKYLKPDTLFNSEKFEKYIDEVLDSGLGKAASSNLTKGDILTESNLSSFSEKDWLLVMYTDMRVDVDEREEREARVPVKQVLDGMRLDIGVYKFIEALN